MKFGYKNSKMVQVNQFFKPPYYFPGRISSKIGRKVVQENCELMSTFHITLRTLIVGAKTTDAGRECQKWMAAGWKDFWYFKSRLYDHLFALEDIEF